MTEAESMLLQAIREIVFDRETSDKVPAHALSIEVAKITGLALQEVSEAAVSLEARRLIKIGKTLNYEYYKLI